MASEGSAPELHDLLRRARAGDEAALGILLERHRDWLRSTAEKELDGQLAARIDASDVVQQTFLSACRQFGQFDGESSGEFAAWLRQIQQRNVQDAVRRHVSADRRSVRQERSLESQAAAADATTPSQHVIRGERADRLTALLAALPDDQRDAVRLRHLEGWSLAQLAVHFGRSHDAVAALLKRGVENLRSRMPRD